MRGWDKMREGHKIIDQVFTYVLETRRMKVRTQDDKMKGIKTIDQVQVLSEEDGMIKSDQIRYLKKIDPISRTL